MGKSETEAKPEKSPQTQALEGLALAAAFLVYAIACRFIPTWLDAGDVATTIWYIVGVICGAIALAGGLTEASRLTKAEFWSDFGAAGVLAGITLGCFFAANRWQLASPLDGIVKSIGLFCGAFAIYGTFTGIAKALDPANRRPERGSKRSRNVGGVVVLLGFATAVINFIAAVRK